MYSAAQVLIPQGSHRLLVIVVTALASVVFGCVESGGSGDSSSVVRTGPKTISTPEDLVELLRTTNS